MSKTKEHYWPAEPPARRPPSPIKHALRAAWNKFRRDLKQQRRRAQFLKDTKIF